MPPKIKALWIVCLLIIVFGFVLLSVRDQIRLVQEKQAAQAQQATENKAHKKQPETSEVPDADPIKEIRELNAMGKHAEATKLAEELARVNPDDAKVHTWWGISLVKSARKKEAIEKFILSSQLDDKNTRTFLYWGLTLAMENRFEEAIEKYTIAVELDPESSNAFAYWGAALNQQKKYQEASIKLEQALDINPFNETAYGVLIDAFYHMGEYDRAWKTVGRAKKAEIRLSEDSVERLARAMSIPATQ